MHRALAWSHAATASSRSVRRVAAGVLVLAVLAAGCAQEPAGAPASEASAPAPVSTVPVPPPTTPSGAAAPTPAPQPTPTEAAAAQGGQAGDAPAAEDGAAPDTPPPEPSQAPAAEPIDVGGPLGSACRPLLQPQIGSLMFEVDTQPGADLPSGVVDHLVTTAAGVVDKPGGVAADTSGVVDSEDTEWTLEELQVAADSAGSIPQSGDRAVIHVLSLRGQPDQSDDRIADSIGLSFGATRFVVFGDRVDSLAGLLGGGEAVLRAVVVHELGHLLCLVNLDYSSEIDHEDPEHPGHSRSEASVMFHAIETTAVGQLFSGPPPDAFDADDLADLEGLRTGRY